MKKIQKPKFPIELGLDRLNDELKSQYEKEQKQFEYDTKTEHDMMIKSNNNHKMDYLRKRLKYLKTDIASDSEFETTIPNEYTPQAKELLGKDSIVHVKSFGFSLMINDNDPNKVDYFDIEMNENMEKVRPNINCFRSVAKEIDDYHIFRDNNDENVTKKLNIIESNLSQCEKPHFEMVEKIRQFFDLPKEKQKQLID